MSVNPNPQQLWIRLWDGGSAIKKLFPNKLGRYVNKNRTQMMCKWCEHYNWSKILERHQMWHWWILHHYFYVHGTPTFTGHRVVKVPLCNCFTFPHVPIASHNLVLYPFSVILCLIGCVVSSMTTPCRSSLCMDWCKFAVSKWHLHYLVNMCVVTGSLLLGDCFDSQTPCSFNFP